ncbi:hypothetical protein C5L38_00865 [Streptomyces sp. WAC00288]|nr:hypothetical protein C5L38_00865 [Streptomyces sp. WAC00288]
MGAGRAAAVGLPREGPRPVPVPVPVPDRQCVQGALHVLHDATTWRPLPFETGSGSDRTCWRRLDRRQKAGIFFSRLELGHGTRPARVSRMIVLRVLGRRAGLRTARTAYRRPGPVFPFQPDPAAATAQAAVCLTGQPCPWAAVEWRVGRVSSCRRGLGWSADG